MVNLKVGDVQRLASGGPEMTLLKQDAEGQWVCGWFRDKQFLQGTFPAEVLIKPPKSKRQFDD